MSSPARHTLPSRPGEKDAAPAAPSAASRPVEPLPGGMRVLATVSIALVTAMTVLDTTIANVALPTIAGNLGVAPSQGTLVITFYGVANAIAIPLTGWLARRFGEVRVFTLATFFFVLASLLCGLSHSLLMLIAARIIQGAAAGPLIPLSQSLLLTCYPPEKRGLALAMWSMTIVVGPILGPILGGYICDDFSWNWIFFVNVPLGIFCLLALRIVLDGRETPVTRARVDKIGLILLVLGVGSLQLMLDEGKDHDWFASPLILGLGVVAAIALVFFVAWELTEKEPVVDLSLFRHRSFTVGTICIFLGFMLYFASVVLMPMMLQTRMGYTAMWAGFTLAPIGIFSLFISPILGKNAARLDMRVLASISFVVFALCFFWRSYFAPNMDVSFVMWPQFVQGLAVALFFMPLTSLSLNGIPGSDIASAMSLSSCLRTLGGSIGSSLVMTQWERLEALHHVRFAESMTDASFPFVQAMQGLQGMGMSAMQATAWINQEVTRQGFLVGFNELFWAGGWAYCLMAGLVWLAPAPQRRR